MAQRDWHATPGGFVLPKALITPPHPQYLPLMTAPISPDALRGHTAQRTIKFQERVNCQVSLVYIRKDNDRFLFQQRVTTFVVTPDSPTTWISGCATEQSSQYRQNLGQTVRLPRR
jgi:hypothetical protein